MVLGIPGPIAIRKVNSSDVMMKIEWQNREGVDDLTGYEVILKNVNDFSQIIKLSTNKNSVIASGLIPGTLYSVSVCALRNESKFGRKSEETSTLLRTSKNQFFNGLQK